MESTIAWNVSGVLYDPQATTLTTVDTPRTVGAKSFRLDYQFIRSSAGRSWVYLNSDILVYGLPDTIMLDIKSNHLNHIADIIISDDNDELFTASTGLFNTASNSFETYKVPLTNFNAVTPGASFNFPIRISAIQIKLWYQGAVGDTNRGTLYFDNLRVKYPVITKISADVQNNFPYNFKLFQNYPNPFNPVTTIGYQIGGTEEVLLEIFDLLGRRVVTLVEERQPPGMYQIQFEAGHMASGIYLYRLKTENGIMIKKMILMR
jgi:hypothetical protein